MYDFHGSGATWRKNVFLANLKQPHQILKMLFRVRNKNLEDKERVFDVLKSH